MVNNSKNSINEELKKSVWRIEGHDYRRTYRSGFEGPLSPEFKWRYCIPVEGGWTRGQGPVFDSWGNIYLKSRLLKEGDYLVALNHQGNLLWKVGGKEHYISDLVISENDTIFINWNGAVCELDTSNGSLLWRTGQQNCLSFLGISKKMLYLILEDFKNLSILNIETGEMGDRPLPESEYNVLNLQFGICNDDTIVLAYADRIEFLYEIKIYNGRLYGGSGGTWISIIPGKKPKADYMSITQNNLIIYVVEHTYKGAIGADSEIFATTRHSSKWSIRRKGYRRFSNIVCLPDGSILFSDNSEDIPKIIKVSEEGKKSYFDLKSLKVSFEQDQRISIDEEGDLYLITYLKNGTYLSRIVLEEGVIKNKVREKWRIQISKNIIHNKIAPIIGKNKTIYLWQSDDYLYAFGES